MGVGMMQARLAITNRRRVSLQVGRRLMKRSGVMTRIPGGRTRAVVVGMEEEMEEVEVMEGGLI